MRQLDASSSVDAAKQPDNWDSTSRCLVRLSDSSNGCIDGAAPSRPVSTRLEAIIPSLELAESHSSATALSTLEHDSLSGYGCLGGRTGEPDHEGDLLVERIFGVGTGRRRHRLPPFCPAHISMDTSHVRSVEANESTLRWSGGALPAGGKTAPARRH